MSQVDKIVLVLVVFLVLEEGTRDVLRTRY
jgi:hypothetical protein